MAVIQPRTTGMGRRAAGHRDVSAGCTRPVADLRFNEKQPFVGGPVAPMHKQAFPAFGTPGTVRRSNWVGIGFLAFIDPLIAHGLRVASDPPRDLLPLRGPRNLPSPPTPDRLERSTDGLRLTKAPARAWNRPWPCGTPRPYPPQLRERPCSCPWQANRCEADRCRSSKE